MIQEILDEVLDTSLQPDNNPRYTIKDNNGRIINDNVQIEFKTPVVQNPTPLNKATLSNIQGDLYTQDRYNTPTYSGTAMTLNLPLKSYEKGKIFSITAPANLTNPTLNINKLGAKTVNGKIKTGERYRLVYNGTSFDILYVPEQFLPLAGSENQVLVKVGNYAEWQNRTTKVLGSLGYADGYEESIVHSYNYNFELYKIYKLTVWGNIGKMEIGSGSNDSSSDTVWITEDGKYTAKCMVEIYFWTEPSNSAVTDTVTQALVIKNSTDLGADPISGVSFGDTTSSGSIYIKGLSTSYSSPEFFSSLLEEVLTVW